jgi:uncharacterized protein YbaA (DUF1428 family)
LGFALIAWRNSIAPHSLAPGSTKSTARPRREDAEALRARHAILLTGSSAAARYKPATSERSPTLAAPSRGTSWLCTAQKERRRAMPYVDGFVVPVPKKNIETYRAMSQKMGKVWKEHGALEYHEYIADDVKPGKYTSFPQSVDLKDDETVVFSWIVYPDRATRDRVN